MENVEGRCFFFSVICLQMMPSCFLMFIDSQLSPYCKEKHTKACPFHCLGTVGERGEQDVFHTADTPPTAQAEIFKPVG